MAEYTPMMRQFFDMKQLHPDCLMMFRLGDFYEMFDEDARIASRELDLTLTTRDRGKEKSEQTPMCGVPYHASETYIARLVNKGHKVAICEQVEDPATAKGLVKREIVRVVTPGSVTESSMLDPGKNNFAASIYGKDGVFSFCACDVSTGLFSATVMEDGDSLLDELGRFQPREVLLTGDAISDPGVDEALKRQKPDCLEIGDPREYHDGICRHIVNTHFKEQPSELPEAVMMAAGSLILMLRRNLRKELLHINRMDYYATGRYMELDLTARRNLELTQSLRTGEKQGSLLWVLDRTKTAMGSRLLRSWIEKPLLELRRINLRQDAVGELVHNTVARSELQRLLRQVTDLERVMGRVTTGICTARDLRMLADGAQTLPQIKEILSSLKEDLWRTLAHRLDALEDLREEIDRTIVAEPPMSVREGGMILEGCNEELDRLRDIMSGGKGELTKIEQREKEATGIKNLKVGYNRVFGYYIEVTHSQIHLVPDTYTRKQTLATGERFITPELKDLEHTILTARDQVMGMEYELFYSLRSRISNHDTRIRTTACVIAAADALASLAAAAAEHNYCRPYVYQNVPLQIKGGRHPVVEKTLTGSLFVPNDTVLGEGSDRVAIITGPNMAGKSTYMRQVALICIMAQIGSFVPAKEATICLVDRVFTRIGAADDLAGGQSTFMVEMAEVAQILRRATPRSLLILDEIGRGTSTYDGMAIARAVLEFAADPKQLGAKTLFATHYHELSAIEQELEGVRNYNISVKKRKGEMIFLRKIVPGAADRSYGVEVAKLAGLPETVLKRARQLLKELEAGTPSAPVMAAEPTDQLSMGDPAASAIRDKLRAMSVETMTPIEAMNALYGLKQMAEQ